MNSADLIKLAKLFDKFIMLKSSVVRIEDIVAVRALEPGKGIEVITPHGSFKDDEDFDALNIRIKDTLEVLKEQGKLRPKSLKKEESIMSTYPHIPNVTALKETDQPQLEQVQRKIVPQKSSRQISIPVGRQGSEGELFNDPNLMIVDRGNLTISTPDGTAVLAQGKEGGMVQGEEVSGFIYANGKYKLAFKKYPHQTALVSFTVNARGVA